MKNDESENDDSSNFSFHLEKKGQSSYLNNINKLTSSTLDRNEMGKGMNQEKFYDCTSVPRVSHKEDFCHIKLDTIHKLKDSTKKLLHILEQINAKTRKKLRICDNTVDVDGVAQPKSLLGISASQLNVSDIVPNEALVRLELQTRIMKNITIDYEDDDCSIYKRLTRKCNCMNNTNYNDLVIHFNENSKYTTNSFGEIVKNLRILKKFLYIGGEHTKNALMFLNEGLLESKVPEKIEIINGCANADICGVFDEHSIVIVCISWPCNNEYFGDSNSQALTATLLHKLSEFEDGRRYLNFSSKITNDIKKVLRKKSSQLDVEIIETLHEVLNLLRPIFVKNPNVSYICKPANEGIGSRTIKDLVESRNHMTLNEIFMHLDLLRNFSKIDFGKDELVLNLPALILLFKDLLMEYDNSEMNILIMNMLTNLMAKHIKNAEDENDQKSNLNAISDVTTKPIEKKNEAIQMPPKRNSKKAGKSMKGLGASPVKLMNKSRRKITDWEPANSVNRSRKFSKVTDWEPFNNFNRSRKFSKDMRSSIIVVPIEK
ncbi:uncharacterized protein LOC123713463 isoform X1 [Pieris brassicae]|uniref:uncharacterized protein LOC123713463 isoform X1 n=1 Tax=Pieris brassicae TaxID=7116 RepID=UPI001E65F97F|nr:uncharacterized protein LOC123713463 isoform X1 [Pieris brassicae]